MQVPNEQPTARVERYARCARALDGRGTLDLMSDDVLKRLEDALKPYDKHQDPESDDDNESTPKQEVVQEVPPPEHHSSAPLVASLPLSPSPPRNFDIIDVLSKEIVSLTLERDDARKAAAAVKITPELRKRRLIINIVAAVGWLVLLVNLIQVCCTVYAYATSEPPPTLPAPPTGEAPPFDPIVGEERHGECTPSAMSTCYELPAFFAGASLHRSRQLTSIASPLKLLAQGRAQQPVYIVTEGGRVDLVDLRNSMQRKIGDKGGYYDFMCAEFLGFPLDYCITRLRFGNRSTWMDIADKISITAFNYSAALTARFRVARALCSGEVPAVEADPSFVSWTARYFFSVCAMLHTADGSIAEVCREGSEALILQQVYEWQNRLNLCKNGDHTGAIVEHIRARVTGAAA